MDLWSTQTQPLSWHLDSFSFCVWFEDSIHYASSRISVSGVSKGCLYMLVNSHSWLVLCVTPTHNFLLKSFLFWRFRSAGLILWWWCSLSHVQLCDPTDFSTPGLPAHRQLPEFTQTHVHWINDVIQPIHPLVSFCSCLHSFPASGSFQMSQFFTSGGQTIRASASLPPMNIQDWSPLGWTGWISWQSKGLIKSLLQHHSSKASIFQHSAFFMVQLVHPYMTTGKTIALTRQTFAGKVMSLL